MRSTFNLAWERFTLITAIIGEAQGRMVAVVFYFTILMPFALGARCFGQDVLRRQASAQWLDRAPNEADLDSARRQG